MAPRPGDQDEIFTDLLGNPDPVDDKDLSVLDEDDLGEVPASGKAKKEEIDPDLLVDDEEDEDEGAAAAAAAADANGEEEDEEEEEEEEAPATAAASDFDPKDVQIVLAETRNLELRENVEKSNVERAKSDIAAAEAAMLKAKEDGDSKADVAATKAFAKATVELDKAEAVLQSIENEKVGLASRARALLEKAPKNEKGEAILDRRVEATPARTETKAPKGSKLVPKFVEKNPWFSNPKFAAQAATLRGIDQGLAAEKKLNKNDPAYFEELGRRFNAVYPGLYKGLDGKVIATGKRQRGSGSPVPGSGGGGGGAPQGGGSGAKVKLTGEDLKLMPKFGMDPSNMEHRKIWLTEKRAQERAA